MRLIELHDHAALPSDRRDALAARVAAQRTLADVLQWASTHAPPLAVAEIVTQDEYTHDVVLPLDASRSLYLAYDTT